MKASAFAYARATSVANALELLAMHGDKAKVLSGGQSLIPAMNLRLVAPELIVDIGDLEELRGIAVRGDTLVIGALTRHADLLKSSDIVKHAPLLAAAVAHVAHPAIRNRGTLGGSLAQADPAAELPACMLALDATIVVRGPAGERRIAAAEFYTGIYETKLARETCWWRSNCRCPARTQPISSTNLRGGKATTRSSAWRRRRCCRMMGSPTFGSAISPSATGRCWQRRPRSSLALQSRRRFWPRFRRRFPPSWSRTKTSRLRRRCGGILPGYCWPAALRPC